MKPFYLLFLVSILIYSCETNKGFIAVDNDDSVLVESRQMVNETWSSFAEMWRIAHGKPDLTFEVMTRFTTIDHAEHLWLNVTSIEGDKVTGVLNQEPMKINNLKIGDTIVISVSQVEDYLFANKTSKEYIGDFSYEIKPKPKMI